MVKFKTQFALFFSTEDGVTGMEYALLGALIAVVIIGAVTGTGTSLSALFQNVADKVGNAITGTI